MSDNISDAALGKIHGKSDYWKAVGYWIGFLKGVVASRAIEEEEKAALVSHSKELFEGFQDGDAFDVLEDLDGLEDEEMYELLEQVISVRSSDEEYRENVKLTVEFYGFLKGIACDSVITLDEIKTLIEFISLNEILLEDVRISDIYKASKLAIADGIISEEEQEEILTYISRVVGDSMADTGISTSRDIPALEGMLQTLENYDFRGKEVVLTGTFCMLKRIFWEFLEEQGATAKKGISKNTDLLICSEVGSEHYVTPNAGTKILRAIDYYSSDGQPEFAMEHMLLNLMENKK